MLCWSRW